MKIIFSPMDDFASQLFEAPKPANLFIPEWYKEMPRYIHNDDKYSGLSKESNVVTNTTLKSCSPFLDALTFGYMWCAPADIEIRKNENGINFKWRVSTDLITQHDKVQHTTLPKAVNGEDFVLKWSFNFSIETPKGYSTMFTHPINRHDLPFRTFTGIVDTDKYHIPVQFPFQFISNEMKELVIIEKGTPLCQMFPIKRDSWQSETKTISNEEKEKRYFSFQSKIVKSYKNQFWSKKVLNSFCPCNSEDRVVDF